MIKKEKPVKSAEQKRMDKLVKQYIPKNRTPITSRTIVQGQPGPGMKWKQEQDAKHQGSYSEGSTPSD